MSSVKIDTPADLWSLLVEIGRDRKSGLIAAGAPHGLLCRVREGCIVGTEGDLPADDWGVSLAAASTLADATVERAIAMAQIARVAPARLLAELGLADEATVEGWAAVAIFRAIVLADGPWEWRELPIDDAGQGVSVLDALARALASADSVQLGRWGAPLNDLVFVANMAQVEDIDRDAASWLAGLTEPRPLKDLLREPVESPRLTLAWCAIARNAGWLSPAGTGDAEDASGAETSATAMDTPELEAMIEVEPVEQADTDDFVVLDDNQEIAEVDVLLDASEASESPDVDVLPEAEAVVAADNEPVVAEASVEAVEEPLIEPAPIVEPEPAPVVEAEPVRKRFYEVAVPADIHKRLGVPPGAAGQGVLQAYSKRYRRVQKLLAENPGDPVLEAWRSGLLHAYRILNNAEALTWYERVASRGDEPDPAGYVAREMAGRAYERGLALLRGGDLIEAGKALQEALNWDDSNAQAWLALGLQQAAHDDDPDEIASAYRSFSQAVHYAPQDPHAHYYRAVAARYAGAQDAFAEEQAWLEQHADVAPDAWSRFRDQAA
ncbi:MAG: hypothetical protein D6761_04775 [Candidatus Dadabacteria bacterium]|nr:MAG: hypothetical protein D6761_04775 [Candidatus Dadabacteria bacterium]